MNDTPHLWPAEVWRWHVNPAHIRRMITTWSTRKRFRRELERLATANPHLIDDIGLTRRQAESEIAKPFWQA